MPVDVVSNPAAPLGPSDLAVLVVETVDPPLRAAATRVLTEDVPYVVLVRRDVWSAGSAAVHKLLDEVQRDPRRKLIRFWRDRDDLERTLREDVFTLDDCRARRPDACRDGSFVKVGSTFEQVVGAREHRLLRLGGPRAEGARERAPRRRSTRARARSRGPSPASASVVRSRFTAPDEPCSCRSVWQMVDGATAHVCFPWATGLWCQVLAVY